jgi:hypothetical protein
MVAPTAQAATSLTTARVIWGLYIVFALMARHNLKLGRGDTRGAWRVGLYIGVVMLVSAVVGGFTGPDGWFPLSAAPVASGLFFALAYLAIEPWTRRLWPHVIITWTRVIAGRWRDPLVARDVLAAVTCVTASYALLRLVQFAALRAGEPPLPPQTELNFGISLTQLLGGSVMLSAMVRPLTTGLWVSVVLFFSALRLVCHDPQKVACRHRLHRAGVGRGLPRGRGGFVDQHAAVDARESTRRSPSWRKPTRVPRTSSSCGSSAD